MFSFRLVSVVVVFKAYLYVRVDPCVYMYVFVVTWVIFLSEIAGGSGRYSPVFRSSHKRTDPVHVQHCFLRLLPTVPAPVLSRQRQR